MFGQLAFRLDGRSPAASRHWLAAPNSRVQA
jgi:hypothetical protein